MCTYVFEINLSTKLKRSFSLKKVSGIIVKGKDQEAMQNDRFALNNALRKANMGNKRHRLVEIIIDKYICEAFVD